MDIINNLLKAIPLVDEVNKKVLSDLLVKKLQEQAEVKEIPRELTQAEKDLKELLEYNGEDNNAG